MSRTIRLTSENDMCPPLHSDWSVPHARHAHTTTGDRVPHHAFIARSREQRDREKIVPGAQASNVLVRGGTVVHLEQRSFSTAHHGRDELERERIAQCTDRAPKLAGRAPRHLAQGQSLAVRGRP